MKKIIGHLMFVLPMLLLVHISAYAQPKMAAGADPEGEILGCGIFCLNSFFIEVPITNLDLFAPNGNVIYEYFPKERPRMFLKTEFFGTEYIKEIKHFTYDHTAQNDVKVYIAKIRVPIDICEICSVIGSGIHTIPVNMSLLTRKNDKFIPYPACNYVGSLDIFSCEYFPKQNCTSNMCDNDLLTIGTGLIRPDCGSIGCIGELPSGTETLKALETFDIHIVQNPVNSTVVLTSDKNLSEVSLTILNSAGQVVQHILQDQDITHLKIDVSDQPEGLYYLQIMDSTSRIIKKFIKQ